MLSYVTTIIFYRPDQFQWPCLISIIAVYMAGGLNASFVRNRRGHLVHLHSFKKLIPNARPTTGVVSSNESENPQSGIRIACV